MKTILSAILLATSILVSPWQTATAQETPTVPTEIQKLDRFLGNWKANVTDSHGKEITQLTSSMHFKPVASGWGIYVEESWMDPKNGEMKAVDLVGYDPFGKKVHCYTVDNAGTTHDHLCSWKSDNVFYMEHNSKRDGKPYQERITCTLTGKDAWNLRSEIYVAGKLTNTLTGTFNRTTD